MSAPSTSADFNKDLPIYEDDDQPPTEEDCCNSGCSPCVFDIYEKRKEEKKKKKGEEQLRYDLLSRTSFKPFILLEKRDFSGCYSRLTFQPFVPKTVIVEKHSKNIVLESDMGLGNMMSRVEKMEFDVISEENSGNMISEKDTENIGLDRNKGHENVIGRVGKGKFEVISGENSGNMISEKATENIGLDRNKGHENVIGRVGKGFEVNSNENKDSDNNMDLENITLEGNKCLENVMPTIEKNGFEVISNETQDSEKNIFLDGDSENINLDGNKDYQNVTSRVGEKGFEVISKENQGSDHNMVSEEDSENIVLDGNKDYQNVASRVGEKGFEVIAKETQVLDMISNTKGDGTILEQQINGYLPYKPGQHLTMKSWRIENSENQKKTRKEDQQMEELNRETYQDTPRREDSFENPKTAGTKFGQDSKVTDQNNLLKTSVSEQVIMGTVVTYQDIQEDSLEDPKFAGTKFGQDSKARDQNLPKNPTSKQTIMGTTKPNFITRDYTPITLAKISSNCCFEIIVKYYEDGEMSKYLKSLRNGDKVLFRGPYGDFEYLKYHNHVLGICMGTGLAPIFAVFRQILDDESDETFLKLLYGCKDPDGILMRTELREMAKFWNFRAEIFLTSVAALESGAKFGENFRAGQITRNCVFENLKPNQLVLVCGSETFNYEIVHWLAEFDRWKVEYFVF